MKRSRIFLLMMVAVVVMFSACDGKKVYDSFAHTPLNGWERNDTVVFSVPAMEQDGTYGMYLNLRTDNSFPFTNITMIVNCNASQSGLHCTDTLKCQLADYRGQSLGKGINLYQYRFRIASEQFSKGDSLSIKVNHNMMREILPGISDVGLTIERE